MNRQILESIKKGELVLFLGAGASFGSQDRDGVPVLMPADLARLLADEAQFPYHGEPLDVVYEAVREQLGVRLDSILEERFKHTTPSGAYDLLATYSWRRIYTLNIDDALDHALSKKSSQRINKRMRFDPVVDRDRFFEELDFIKLNGSADRLGDGLIFSPSEYAKASSENLPWYSQCASDFVRSPILFVGTSLSEPLLKFHVERYQQLNSAPLGVSYLIAKSATPIQIQSLKKYKIEFIEGTMDGFVEWLQQELPDPASPRDLALESIPQLRAFIGSANKLHRASLFDHVLSVRSDNLPASIEIAKGAIRDFYKGFKPVWQDIVEEVPAQLDVLQNVIAAVSAAAARSSSFLPVVGPAGSGKTTILMQVAWHFGRQTDVDIDVYFLDAVPDSLLETLIAIEEESKSSVVLIIIDDIEFFIDGLEHALKSGRLKKTLILGAERQNVWSRRAKVVLDGMCEKPLLISEFTENDALKILDKLKEFGSWTRLGKMRSADRLKELVRRSRKQLLIALLEATLGRGFEKIIEDEYSSIDSVDERTFLISVAIATDRRCNLRVSLLDRALDKVGILSRASSMASNLIGIVHLRDGGLTARHPVYARFLLKRVVDPSVASKAITGLLEAFADFKAPVIQNIPKSDSVLYKGIINHRFLYELLNGKRDFIIPLYKGLEKRFESDGLFWLQYGLSLRDFDESEEALAKLRIAVEAYPMPHTEHALAQQLLQVAVESHDAVAAISLADEAKVILNRLDDIIDSDDTYPIVTLGEGYTNVLRRHESEDSARNFARSYSIILGQRVKESPERDRLKVAYERLFTFAVTGLFKEEAKHRN